MDYKAHHDRLIERARTRLLEGYCERHHILPRCLGGGNEKTNIVALTAREHYIAHQLLVKVYPNESKLIFAAHMMSRDSVGNRISNRSYKWIRERFARVISEALTGRKKGTWSKERRLAKSKSMKGNIPWNKGRTIGPRSENTKAKIRDGMLGINLGRKLGPHSLKSNRQRSLTLTGTTHEIVNCPHCNKSGGMRAMKRWHFNKCKHRSSLA